MRDALEGLWPENAEAWRVFQQVVTRFACDLRLTGECLRRLVPEETDPEVFSDLLARLGTIYEWLYPPQTVKTDAS